jgi:hypothetical protein
LALENAIYRSAFIYLKLQKAKTSLEKWHTKDWERGSKK